MKNILSNLSFMAGIIMMAGCVSGGPADVNDTSQKEQVKPSDDPGLYAVIEVTRGEEKLGEIRLQLFSEKAPETVANFTELATGKKEFVDPATGEEKKARFYDGIIFHRIIENFMIQTGDPTGTGRGGPGYRFEDEFSDELKFDQKGILAMANSGPNTNGSQFFITLQPTPWLNNRHTIFGEVVEGMDVVEKISMVETDHADRPAEDIVMERVRVIDID